MTSDNKSLADRPDWMAEVCRHAALTMEANGLGNSTEQLRNVADQLSTLSPQADKARGEVFDFAAHLARQRQWSETTFGPGARTAGVIDHIRKELCEVEASPEDGEEWVDVVILALDGAWRSGLSPDQIIAGIVAKQTKNEGRTWPDWRTADPTKAIEHERTGDWKAGDLVRYDAGETALAELVAPHAGGWHARQCMGGLTFISEDWRRKFYPLTPDDRATWERCAKHRRPITTPQPQGDASPQTPSSRWSEKGEADPHGTIYDCERAALAHGDMTDDELANAVFLADHRNSLDSMGLLTAAKERIRWLSRRLQSTVATPQARPDGGEEARGEALRRIAAEIYREWDDDNDSRVGKMLRALCDPAFARTYRNDIAALHDGPTHPAPAPDVALEVPYQECYAATDGDTWFDSPDDAEFTQGRKVGDTYEVRVSHYSIQRTYVVTKAPDDTSDDYEVRPLTAAHQEATNGQE